MYKRPVQFGETFLNELVIAYSNHLGSVHDSDAYHKTAWSAELLLEFASFDPEALWAFILYANSAELSEWVRGNIAAGALEDLINYSGASYITQIESEWGKNQKFRDLLDGVWGPEEDDTDYNEVWKRVYELQRKQHHLEP